MCQQRASLEELVVEAEADPTDPPHIPSASDHATLWLDDSEAAVYSMHVYLANIEEFDNAEPPYKQWFDLLELPPSRDSKSASSGSLGTISAVQCRSFFIHANDTGNRSSFHVVCSQSL